AAAPASVSRCAYGVGVWTTGLRVQFMGNDRRAGGHTERNYRAARCRNRQGARCAGGARETGCSGLYAAWLLVGRVATGHARAACALRYADQASWHKDRAVAVIAHRTSIPPPLLPPN